MEHYPSIFNEALAPVTPGPSSSNTAGPFRIARTCLEFFGQSITKASIEMSSKGSFPFTYFGMRSDMAFIGGLLGRRPDHPRFLYAYEDAEAAGIAIEYHFLDDLPADPSEYVRLVLSSSITGKSMTFCGASVGGGGFYLDSVNGCSFHTRGYHHEILLFSSTAGREACEMAIRTLIPSYEAFTVCSGLDRVMYDIKLVDEPSQELLKALKAIPGTEDIGVASPKHTVTVSKKRRPVFETPAELVAYADGHDLPLWEAAVNYEASLSGWTPEEVLAYADKLWTTVVESVEGGYREGNDMNAVVSCRAPGVRQYYKTEPVIPGGILDTAVPIALSIQEYSNSSGIIVCIPTGGASGVVPGVILGAAKEMDLSREQQVKGLLVAGLMGVFMAETDYFGAYGCQAEIGCAVGMAAGALVSIMGGKAKTACDAASMGIQSLLGLVCDSVCGASQVPCFIRNMTGTATALVCANAAMAGLDALIPLDEMVDTLMRVGTALRSARLNTMGANASPTGLRLEKEEIARQKKVADEKLRKNHEH